MKDTVATKAVEKVVALKLAAVDVVIEDLIHPLEYLGSPEKIIGKPYDQWTSEDLQKLVQIYSTREPNQLSNLIFKKSYEEVQQLEQEAGA